MGCDIHAIFEIKQNGKWCYVPDLPDEFEDRCYGMFAMLNTNVRNSCGVHGFEGKGLPSDIAGKRYRFRSQRAELEHGYKKRGTHCCYVSSEEMYNVYDEKLTTIIDDELLEHLMDGMTTDETLRYYYPRRRIRDGITECVVQDASVVGGQFMQVPFTTLYKDIKEYNDAYYKYEWVNEYEDFGYFEVDFTSKDYHSHSYLTLKELLSKVKDLSPERVFEVPSGFIEELMDDIGYLPERFTAIKEDINAGIITIALNDDCEIFNIQKMYNDAVAKVQAIKKKYGIQDDENIRVIFAFDS